MSKISKVLKNKVDIKKVAEDIDRCTKTFNTTNDLVINDFKKEEKKTPNEMVNHPDHYAMVDKTYEPYKVIAAWEANFNIGNAIKYLARYKKKWNPIEDLQKAKQYIDFEIEYLNKMTSND